MLLSSRDEPLLCEELVLRARMDLDAGRIALAAIGLERAYATALVELVGEHRADLAVRVEELAELRGEVERAARNALPNVAADPETQVVRHGLERLEAALRARTAAGFTVR